jgi:hypothetical protein
MIVMQNENLIPADELCSNYNIEISFINMLNEFGLIEVSTIEERDFIPSNQLSDVEKYMHLHYDLEINIAGIEAISHMLERIKNMQQEMLQLRNRLRLYEHL